MAEYIDKQELITEIQSAVSMVLQTAPYEKVWFDRFVDRQNEIMAIIERQPAAEVEPVRHGRWEWLGPNSLAKECMCGTCSACKVRSKYIVNREICPNCGARMDLGGADNG